MILMAEAVMTGLIGLWMLSGAFDNWRFPDLNRATVSRVMRLELMEEQYPEDFARVAHRRVNNPVVINIAFRLLTLWETFAAVLLCTGAALLGLAAITGTPTELGQDIALIGALAFTMNWAGFLIGGNYFCYYYCHFEGQFTHFMLLIWGAVVCAMLTVVQVVQALA